MMLSEISDSDLAAELDRRRLEHSKNKNFNSLSEFDFYSSMRLFSPQQWSIRAENYQRNQNGWEKVSPSEARGDAKGSGKYYELKTTFISLTNPQANFVQLRPHHEVDYALTVVMFDNSVQKFCLTHRQMNDEIRNDPQLAHGTKQKESSDTDEYAIRIKPGSTKWNEWVTKYGVSSFSWGLPSGDGKDQIGFRGHDLSRLAVWYNEEQMGHCYSI